MDSTVHIVFATTRMRDRMSEATHDRLVREVRKVQGTPRIFRGPTRP
jgi:hypothetical protein